MHARCTARALLLGSRFSIKQIYKGISRCKSGIYNYFQKYSNLQKLLRVIWNLRLLNDKSNKFFFLINFDQEQKNININMKI